MAGKGLPSVPRSNMAPPAPGDQMFVHALQVLGVRHRYHAHAVAGSRVEEFGQGVARCCARRGVVAGRAAGRGRGQGIQGQAGEVPGAQLGLCRRNALAGVMPRAARRVKGLTRLSKSWRPWNQHWNALPGEEQASKGIRFACRRAPL